VLSHSSSAGESMSVKIRFIQQPDLEPLLAAERAFNTVPDPNGPDQDGNESFVLNPWSLSAQDVLDVIRCRRDSEAGTYDTRTYVALKGAAVEGGFALRLMPSHLEFAFIICKPGETFGHVLRAILKRAKDKAWRSKKRRKLILFLRDGEEAGLRLFVPSCERRGSRQNCCRTTSASMTGGDAFTKSKTEKGGMNTFSSARRSLASSSGW
jgi:hypothetical protein